MKRRPIRLAAGSAAAILALAACAAPNEASVTDADGTAAGGGSTTGSIAGAGASSQAAAMEAWKASFESANPDATVTYDPVGSSGGRGQFISGGVQFAGSDAYLDDEEITAATERCGDGEVIQLPAYVSPIAVAYNLEGVEDLRLSPETLAKIFTQTITTWDDPAIVADNPDATLPSTAITPVNRSDGSGTTKNFTDYLSAAAPAVWTFGAVDDWPVKGGTGGQGTSGVVTAVGQADGAIGYADASQIGDLPAASVKVGEEYVAPSSQAAAKIIDASPRVEGRGEFDFAIDIDRETQEAGTYPIVLAAYTMACTAYDDPAQAALVKDFLSYIVSKEGQLVSQENAGSAPISDTFRADAQKAIDAIVTE